MRPRKSVNVASIVGSPEEEESRPNLRLRIVGVVVLLLFGVLVLRLWTLQVVEGKTYAAAVTRNQVRVVSIPAPRGEIVDRNGTVLVSNTAAAGDPALAGRGGAEPEHRGHGGRAGGPDARSRCRRPSTTTSTAPTSRCRWRSASRPPRCSTSRRTRRSTPASASRPWRSAPTPRAGPRPPTSSGYVGDISPSYLAAHPNDGYTQGSQIGVSGIEAQYEPYLRGVDGRQALSVDASGTVVGTLARPRPRSATRWCSTSTPACSRQVQNDLQSADPGRPPHARRGRRWPAPRRAQRRRDRDGPAERPGAGAGLVPDLRPNEWVGGISSANFTALQASGRGEQLRHRGPVHARVDLQARHGHGGAPGRADGRRPALQRHRDASRSPAARRPGSTTTPGASCTTTRATAAAPTTSRAR